MSARSIYSILADLNGVKHNSLGTTQTFRAGGTLSWTIKTPLNWNMAGGDTQNYFTINELKTATITPAASVYGTTAPVKAATTAAIGGVASDLGAWVQNAITPQRVA